MATPEQVAAVIEPIAPPAPVPKQKKAKKKTPAKEEDVKPVILDLTEPHDEQLDHQPGLTPSTCELYCDKQRETGDPPLFVSEDGAVHYTDYDSDDDDNSSGGYTLWNLVTAYLGGIATGVGVLSAAIGYFSALEEKKLVEQYEAQVAQRNRFIAELETQSKQSEPEEKQQP
jgi:hypothetical protein